MKKYAVFIATVVAMLSTTIWAQETPQPDLSSRIDAAIAAAARDSDTAELIKLYAEASEAKALNTWVDKVAAFVRQEATPADVVLALLPRVSRSYRGTGWSWIPARIKQLPEAEQSSALAGVWPTYINTETIKANAVLLDGIVMTAMQTEQTEALRGEVEPTVRRAVLAIKHGSMDYRAVAEDRVATNGLAHVIRRAPTKENLLLAQRMLGAGYHREYVERYVIRVLAAARTPDLQTVYESYQAYLKDGSGGTDLLAGVTLPEDDEFVVEARKALASEVQGAAIGRMTLLLALGEFREAFASADEVIANADARSFNAAAQAMATCIKAYRGNWKEAKDYLDRFQPREEGEPAPADPLPAIRAELGITGD